MGGGVAQGSSQLGRMTFWNATISRNAAVGLEGGWSFGGGIYGSTSVTLTHCTVADNYAYYNPFGGGLFSAAGPGGGVAIRNTIFADNEVASGANGPDIYGYVRSRNYNLIETSQGYTLVGPGGYNIIGQDALLDPLADNGGDTMTYALQTGSPAVDAGACTDVNGSPVLTDQRDEGRPQGANCDIGAYESSYSRLQVTKGVDDSLPNAGQPITYTITIQNDSVRDVTAAVVTDTLPVSLTFAGPVTLDPPGAGVVGVPPVLVSSLTITAGEEIRITLPVTVNQTVPAGEVILNTAVVASAGMLPPHADSKAITVRDSVSPTILSISPLSGSVGVGLAAPLVITFSEPMETGSLSYTIAPDPGGWAAAWGNEGAVVTLTHADFVPWRMYQVTIITACDRAQNPLIGAPYTWRFTTVPYRIYLPLLLNF